MCSHKNLLIEAILMSTNNISFSILTLKNRRKFIPNLQLWDFFQGTQERVRNSHGKWVISVRAIEVLLHLFNWLRPFLLSCIYIHHYQFLLIPKMIWTLLSFCWTQFIPNLLCKKWKTRNFKSKVKWSSEMNTAQIWPGLKLYITWLYFRFSDQQRRSPWKHFRSTVKCLVLIQSWV